MQNYLQEIERITVSTENSVPAQRKAFNQVYSFSHLDFESQLHIWAGITKLKVKIYAICVFIGLVIFLQHEREYGQMA